MDLAQQLLGGAPLDEEDGNGMAALMWGSFVGLSTEKNGPTWVRSGGVSRSFAPNKRHNTSNANN